MVESHPIRISRSRGPEWTATFSSPGNNLPSKASINKKFDHLNTKELYIQFGDTGTGGRYQDIIPLQDWDGQVNSGAEGVGSGSKQDLAKGEDVETDQAMGGEGGISMSALAESLQNTEAVIEKNIKQDAQLAQNQAWGQERIERMEKVIEGHAQNSARDPGAHGCSKKLFEMDTRALTESHLKSEEQSRTWE